MAKKKISKPKKKNNHLRLIMGVLILLLGIIGLKDLISLVLVFIGGYLIYNSPKKN